MIPALRRLLKRLIPPTLRQHVREYRDLPPTARRAWRGAILTRTLSGRDITRLPAGLPERPHVLVVCYGNIYRSPYAHALLRRAVEQRPPVRLTLGSAGLLPTQGRPSPPDAQALAAQRGVDLSDHRSSPVTSETLAATDVIVLMDRRNEALLRAQYPAHQHKLVLLGAFHPHAHELGPTIADPYGQGEAALAACFERIEGAVAGLADALVAGSLQPPHHPPARELTHPHRHHPHGP